MQQLHLYDAASEDSDSVQEGLVDSPPDLTHPQVPIVAVVYELQHGSV
jgi:hypothetical protein